MWSFTIFNLLIEPKDNIEWIDDVDHRLVAAIKMGWERNMIVGGDPVIVVTGWKAGAGYTNTMRVIYVPKGDAPPQSLLSGF